MPDIPVGTQIFDLVFHPITSIVFTGLLTGHVKAFSYDEDGGHSSIFTVRPSKRSCRTLAINEDGSKLWAAGKAKSLNTIDVSTGKIIDVRLNAHDAPINRMKRLQPNLLASGDDDGVIKLWDPRRPDAARQYNHHFDFISDFLWLDDSKQLISTSGDGTLSVVDVRSKKAEPIAQSEDQEDELLSIVSIRGGQKFAVGTQLGILSIFNRRSGWGDCVDRIPGHPHSIDTLCSLPSVYASSQSTFLTGSSDGILRAVQLFPTKLLGVVADHGEFPIERIAVDRDGEGRWVGSAGHEEILKLTDLKEVFEDEGDKDSEKEGSSDVEDSENEQAGGKATTFNIRNEEQNSSESSEQEDAEEEANSRGEDPEAEHEPKQKKRKRNIDNNSLKASKTKKGRNEYIMDIALRGIVTITNVDHKNRVAFLEDADKERLRGVIPQLADEVCEAEQWEIIAGTGNRYLINNVKFKYAAAVDRPYQNGTPVVGKRDGKQWWFIEKVRKGVSDSSSYFIRHNEERSLCWNLCDGTPHTPICLQTDTKDEQSMWNIVPYDMHMSRNHLTNSLSLTPPTIPPSISAFLKNLRICSLRIDENWKVCPSTAIALQVLKCASKMIDEYICIDEDIDGLLKSITAVYEYISKKEILIRDKLVEEVLAKLAQQVLECADFIINYSEKKSFWIQSGQDVQSNTDAEIQHFKVVLDDLIYSLRYRYRCSPSIRIHRATQDLDLSKLGCALAENAGMNSSKKCLSGTRKTLLSMIRDWIYVTGDDARQVFWLSGPAGKGKSAVSHTIASSLDERGELASCISFDRTRRQDYQLEKIFTTIARDMAHNNPLVRRKLADVIHLIDSQHSVDFAWQCEVLFSRPIDAASKIVAAPVVVIFDGLDESGTSDTRKHILRLLAGQLATIPSNVRILVTSRLTEDIQNALHDMPHVVHVSIDFDPISTADDIRYYISTELADASIATYDNHLTILATKSDGLFEWARLACAYIKHTGNTNAVDSSPLDRLNAVVTGASPRSAQLLDDMYKLILDDTIPNDKREEAIPIFRAVMGQILALSEPLPFPGLIAMRLHFPFENDRDAVRRVIQPLGSLLTITTDNYIPVRPLHSSFYEFLMDEVRSAQFFVDPSLAQYHLAISSLRIMESGLRFNICSLENSYLPNAAVKSPGIAERMNDRISPELSYSCRNWIAHVCHTPFDESLAGEIASFFRNECLMYWLEAMALMGRLNDVVGTLPSIAAWFKGLRRYEHVSDAAIEAQCFIQMFGDAITYSTPHLYLSALPLCPAQSSIHRIFSVKIRQTVRVIAGGMDSWPQVQRTLKRHNDRIHSVGISWNGQRIVSGSQDTTAGKSAQNAVTSETLGTQLVGHVEDALLAAISYDGKHAVSVSEGNVINLWNIDGGNLVGSTTIEHADSVLSQVAISSDGRRVVSIFMSGAVYIWDTWARNTTRAFSVQGNGMGLSIVSAAISQDGRRVTSLDNEGTVLVFDTETGQKVGSFPQHLRIDSITISWDGRYLVTNSGRRILIWDIEINEQVNTIELDSRSSATSIAVSGDGRCVVCSFNSSTVHIYNVETGLVQLLSSGRHGNVASIAISQDGRHCLWMYRRSNLRMGYKH
ncbi:uncharacterized protein FIBRA_08846 [Fibroporia radiculosa]|uniref:WD repeat-containing protein JIP5 n=1 Tax=Fibroporia radiculosa TaxID=599839 RepID=J4H5D9_9APHY|nr:uncharacterized protein FIBRA_08846 [Fibroporia radiculosa]CCM06569.1 predicted protein [Fibroporia radiculosa]